MFNLWCLFCNTSPLLCVVRRIMIYTIQILVFTRRGAGTTPHLILLPRRGICMRCRMKPVPKFTEWAPVYSPEARCLHSVHSVQSVHVNWICRIGRDLIISTFPPCYAFQIIFTESSHRPIQCSSRKVHKKDEALKRLCLVALSEGEKAMVTKWHSLPLTTHLQSMLYSHYMHRYCINISYDIAEIICYV